MAERGSRFSFKPEQMRQYIWMVFGVAALALVGVVFVLKILLSQGGPPPEPQVAQVSSAAIVYPIPKHRDMLMDTVLQDAPPPSAPDVTVAAPTIRLAPRGSDGKVLLEVGGRLAGTLRMSSPAVQNGRLSIEHTCYRKNYSPPLQWSGVPPQAKSLVLFFEKDDAGPDNPAQWLVYNIPPKSTGLARAAPVGTVLDDGSMQGIGEGGRVGYTGPCVPKGQHLYQFRLFALDTLLPLSPGAHKYDIIEKMNGHVIDMTIYPVMHFYRL